MTIDKFMGLYHSLQEINPHLESEDHDIVDRACRDIANKVFIGSPTQGMDLATISITKGTLRSANLQKFFSACRIIQSHLNTLNRIKDDITVHRLSTLIKFINTAIDKATGGTGIQPHIILPKAIEPKYKDIVRRISPPPEESAQIQGLRKGASQIVEKLITLGNFYNKTLSKKDYVAAEHDEAYLVFDIKKDLEEMDANLPTASHVPGSIIATRDMARKLLGEYENRADFMALSKSKEDLFRTIATKGLPKKINATMQRRLDRIYAKEAAILLFSGDDHRRAEAIQRLAILHDAMAKVPNFSEVFFSGPMQQIQTKMKNRGPSLFFPEIANLKPLPGKERAQLQSEQLNKLKITSPYLQKKRELFQKAIADTVIAANKKLYDELVDTALILKKLAEVVQKNPNDFETSKQLDAAFATWKNSFNTFNTNRIFNMGDFGLNEVNELLVNSKWVQGEIKKIEVDYEKSLLESLPQMNNFKMLRACLASLKASVMIRAPLCVRFSDIIPGKLMDVLKKCRSTTPHHKTLEAVLTDLTYPASNKLSTELLPRFQGEFGSFEKQIEEMKKLGDWLDTVRQVLPDSPEKTELGARLTALSASGVALKKIVAPLKGAKEPQVPNPKAFYEAQQAYMKNCNALLQFLSPLKTYIQTIEKRPEIGPALRKSCEICSATLLGVRGVYPKNMPPSAIFFPGATDLRTIPVLFSQMLPRMEMPLQVLLSCHKKEDARLWLINTLLATQKATHNVNEFLRKKSTFA